MKKWELPRRTFLRGAGVSIALPVLEVMWPSVARAGGATQRFVAVYFGNGTPRDQGNFWTCNNTEDPSAMQLGAALQPLQAHRPDIVVLNNVTNEAMDYANNTQGNFGQNHWHSTCGFLTGQAMDELAVRSDLNVSKLLIPGQSIDWMIAQKYGQQPLIMGIDGRATSPGNDSRGNAYMFFTISWQSQTQCVEHRGTSLEVWNTLFSNGVPMVSGSNAGKRQKRILDFVLADIRRLKGQLPAQDQARLDEHLTTIETIEGNVMTETTMAACTPPTQAGLENDISDGSLVNVRTKNMIDLMALAFSCGICNSASLMLQTDQTGGPDSRYLSNANGQSYLHHSVSHYRDYGDSAAALGGMLIFNQWQAMQLGYLIDKLKATPDTGGTLFDNTLAMLGCGIGDSQNHSSSNLPLVLAGGASGTLKLGRAVDCQGEPLANVLLSMLQKLGVGATSLGRSTRACPFI
jgi:hypothetical protein